MSGKRVAKRKAEDSAEGNVMNMKILPVSNGYLVDVYAEKYTEMDTNGQYVFESTDALIEFIKTLYAKTEDKS
jgi:hypothetical protein